MGGEKGNLSKHFKAKEGSPPRGRGKVYLSPQLGAGDGITPAWAGKSCPHIHKRGVVWDHPRVGGEKGAPALWALCCRGSPPRGRGKVVKEDFFSIVTRITPAWAGKSGRCLPVNRFHEDHPRVGGEKQTRPPSSWPSTGSPPRGRGKAAIERVWKQWLGITPAWAGKRETFGYQEAWAEDHPRVGGEKGGAW